MAITSYEADDIDDFDDFGIDDFDDSALLQLDQIEDKLIHHAGKDASASTSAPAAAVSDARPSLRFQTLSSHAAASSARASAASKPLQRVASTGSAAPSQPPSSGAARQMNLFGKPVELSQSRAAKVVSSSPGHITLSSQSATHASSDAARAGASDADDAPPRSRPPWQQKIGTKTWDREAYLHRDNAKNRDHTAIDIDALEDDELPHGKGKQKRNWDQDSQYDTLLPPPPPDTRRHLGPPLPQKCTIDPEAAKTWIYPTNMEKRDYQYNIVQKALFNNVLVALPTGLGKTFIAAVVILNFFRWFPDGKILFLAPSRPLVDQQKIACHRICGLPWDCAIDLTGNTTGALRGEHWQSKRIFYMTPQTLENDIREGRCDPRDFVCVVVDEAHRARGRYAYGNVIGRIMDVNPHFRVLALSATPGKDSDSVQEVVDQLHINQIEIRTEEAIDVQRYMFRKREEIVNVTLGKDLNKVKDNWAKLMQTQMDPLMKAGLLRNQDPVLLHPFAVNAIARDGSRASILRERPYLRSNISELGQMALSMQYLMEQSLTMFYNRLKERSLGYNAKGKKTSSSKQQIYANNNSTFTDIMRELEVMQDTKGRILHPKMIKLREVLVEHFDRCAAEQMHNAEAYQESGHDVFGCTPKSADLSQFNASSQADTRVMVFCSYRECCDEIVGFLKDSGFRATEFVGQSKAKSGKKGMSQKDQERVIADFKAGKYNVLVATSIGEEGLDIGSVDLTACYEAVKDSIRMLQRIGRTGRKREGKIVVLVSEGREQQNWQHSKDNYKAVQKEVDSRLYVELFDDVDRMVPDNISPRPILKQVEQPEFDPSMVSEGKTNFKAARVKKAPKPKKDPKRNMPEGGDLLAGFRKASSLAKRKRASSDNADLDAGDSDAPPANETHSQKVARLLTMDDDEMEALFEEEDRLLDLDLRPAKERRKAAKLIVSSPPSSPDRSPALRSRTSLTGSNVESPLDTPPRSDGIETLPLPSGLSSSSSSRPLAGSVKGRKLGVGLRRSSGRSATSTLSLRKASDVLDSSEQAPRSRGIATTVISDDDDDDEFGGDDLVIDTSMENALARVEAAAVAPAHVAPVSQSRLGSATTKSPASTEPSKGVARVKPDPYMMALLAEDAERERAERAEQAEGRRKRTQNDAGSDRLPSPCKRPESSGKSSMGPPDSAPRRAGAVRGKCVIVESPDRSRSMVAPRKEDEPEPEGDPASSSPIKAPARRGGRLQKATSIVDSAATHGADTSPTARKGLSRLARGVRLDGGGTAAGGDEPSKGKAASRDPGKATSRGKGEKGKKASEAGGKKRKITNSPRSRALFQYEAERSTDEEEHGERDENDSGLGTSDEDDSDREAVGNFLPTQAPRGYHQQSVYMQSIMSQHAPAEFQRLRHAPFPGLGGKFGEPVTPRRRQRPQMPSSDARPTHGGAAADSSDRYSEDSFVCNDDDEIVYASDVSDALLDSSQFG